MHPGGRMTTALMFPVIDGELADGREVRRAAGRSDNANAVAPRFVRKMERVGNVRAGLFGKRITRSDRNSFHIAPSKMLAHLHAKTTGIPSARGRNIAARVDNLIELVRLRPGISPPVGGLCFLVEIVLAASAHSAGQAVRTIRPAEQTVMRAFADCPRSRC